MAAAMDSVAMITKFRLNTGDEMPSVGLGTYRMRDLKETMEVVDQALSAGYRMFEMGAVYRNESHLKEAFQRLLPKHHLQREDIFVTTKFSSVEHVQPAVIKHAYSASIEHLGLEFANLHLVNFPTCKLTAPDAKKCTELRHATWKGMVDLYDSGLVNAIGVCNFDICQLKTLMKRNHGVVPAVNQTEWHPFFYELDAIDYCKANGIAIQAYCALGEQSEYNDLLLHPSITKIAKSLEVTNAQVVQKWAVQRDISVIPKSDRIDPKLIKENIALNFHISPEDMLILDKLSKTKMSNEDALLLLNKNVLNAPNLKKVIRSINN